MDSIKKLVKMINSALRSEIGIVELIKGFIDYTSEHFMDEETLMFENAYDVYDEKAYSFHKNEHKKFTEALLELSFQLIEAAGNIEQRNKFKKAFLELCEMWFNKHFLNTDKKFTEFYIKHIGGDVQ